MEKSTVRSVQENGNIRNMDVHKERKERESRLMSMEEEKSIAEIALKKEKVEVLSKMVYKMKEKIKKIENLIENMLQTHNRQMERIINLIADIKEERGNKGKLDKERGKILDYNTDDDEFY